MTRENIVVKRVLAESNNLVVNMTYDKIKLEPNLTKGPHIIVTEEELSDLIEVHSGLINQGILRKD